MTKTITAKVNQLALDQFGRTTVGISFQSPFPLPAEFDDKEPPDLTFIHISLLESLLPGLKIGQEVEIAITPK